MSEAMNQLSPSSHSSRRCWPKGLHRSAIALLAIGAVVAGYYTYKA
jgi:hypothetical protein